MKKKCNCGCHQLSADWKMDAAPFRKMDRKMKKNKCSCGCKAGMIAGGTLLAAGIGLAIAYKNRRTMPKGAVPVKNFDVIRYLGQWYEIARMNFHWEKNIVNATAEYSLNADGSIKVVNRGYDIKKMKWEKSVGKAKFVERPDVGELKVSFFGPFYAGYNVIDIDPDYKYALVAGRNHDYLWLLSREKDMPNDIKQTYLEKACALGYDISQLVWTQFL